MTDFESLLKNQHADEPDMHDGFYVGPPFRNIQVSMDSLHILKAAEDISTLHFFGSEGIAIRGALGTCGEGATFVGIRVAMTHT
ncbi:hypothetical protein SK128_022169 [Halocaridina rubra]|uniref:Uncharacterized protein n=1 Tax=Halocaridina rubra TaxID=373956 RepID=A0AAN9AC32_HALRR